MTWLCRKPFPELKVHFLNVAQLGRNGNRFSPYLLKSSTSQTFNAELSGEVPGPRSSEHLGTQLKMQKKLIDQEEIEHIEINANVRTTASEINTLAFQSKF